MLKSYSCLNGVVEINDEQIDHVYTRTHKHTRTKCTYKTRNAKKRQETTPTKFNK